MVNVNHKNERNCLLKIRKILKCDGETIFIQMVQCAYRVFNTLFIILKWSLTILKWPIISLKWSLKVLTYNLKEIIFNLKITN